MHIQCPHCRQLFSIAYNTVKKPLVIACVACGLLFAAHLDEPPKQVMRFGQPAFTAGQSVSVSASLSHTFSMPPLAD